MEVRAGAPPHVNVGCRAGVVLAGRATNVGGPSGTESYECRAGCPCAFGGGVWAGRADRGAVRAAADPGPSGDRRLGAVVARSGGGDLRGRTDRVRAGPVPHR